MIYSTPPEKSQKTFSLLKFSGGIEMEYWVIKTI